MNIISPTKTLRNCIAKENNKIDYTERTAEIELRKNMNMLLFHNSVQNFLRLENSTEEIKLDFNAFLHTNIQKDDQLNLNSNQLYFSDVFYLEMQFESKKKLL